MPVRKGKDAQRQTAYLSPLGGAHSDDYRAMQAARCDLIPKSMVQRRIGQIV
jgi:hypothetical protein